MDIIILALLIIFVCTAGVFAIGRLEDRVQDLEEEVTRMKLEYRGEFKFMRDTFNYVDHALDIVDKRLSHDTIEDEEDDDDGLCRM